jgi:hypothetical protein
MDSTAQQNQGTTTFQRVWLIALLALLAAWFVGVVLLQLPNDYEGRALLFAILVMPISLVLLQLCVVNKGLAAWVRMQERAHVRRGLRALLN